MPKIPISDIQAVILSEIINDSPTQPKELFIALREKIVSKGRVIAALTPTPEKKAPKLSLDEPMKAKGSSEDELVTGLSNRIFENDEPHRALLLMVMFEKPFYDGLVGYYDSGYNKYGYTSAFIPSPSPTWTMPEPAPNGNSAKPARPRPYSRIRKEGDILTVKETEVALDAMFQLAGNGDIGGVKIVIDRMAASTGWSSNTETWSLPPIDVAMTMSIDELDKIFKKFLETRVAKSNPKTKSFELVDKQYEGDSYWLVCERGGRANGKLMVPNSFIRTENPDKADVDSISRWKWEWIQKGD